MLSLCPPCSLWSIKHGGHTKDTEKTPVFPTRRVPLNCYTPHYVGFSSVVPTPAIVANVSRNSIPPAFFMTRIIGRSVFAILCRKLEVADCQPSQTMILSNLMLLIAFDDASIKLSKCSSINIWNALSEPPHTSMIRWSPSPFFAKKHIQYKKLLHDQRFVG